MKKENIKLMVHNEAPSGMIKFYRYKEPFMPNPKPYYGFQGVLLHDSQQPLIQCSECGEWLKSLNGAHLGKHGLNSRTYKQKFGLKLSTALLNEETRVKAIANGIKQSNFLKGKQNSGKPFFKGDPRLTKARYKKAPMEIRNNFGTCPEQILDRIGALSKVLGHQPSYKEFKNALPGLKKAVVDTYGSWQNVCKLLDWEVQKPGLGFGQFSWNADKLIEVLRMFKEKYGREPMSSDQRRGLVPYQNNFTHYFGKSGWTKAKQIAFNKSEV